MIIPAGDALLDDPPRTIHVNVFAIARPPVTNREYKVFVEDSKYERGTWTGGPDDHPAEGISWADAVAYCRWLSIATARVYRLPDEREWEKAARAGVFEDVGALEWTNTWADGRVLRGRGDVVRRLRAGSDLSAVGFRVVRGMTGR